MALMLNADLKTFETELRYRDALIFVNAAILRKECYGLAVMQDRTPTQSFNLKWHLQAPACKEPWFVGLLKHNGCDMETL